MKVFRALFVSRDVFLALVRIICLLLFACTSEPGDRIVAGHGVLRRLITVSLLFKRMGWRS